MFYGSYRDRLQNKPNKYNKSDTAKGSVANPDSLNLYPDPSFQVNQDLDTDVSFLCTSFNTDSSVRIYCSEDAGIEPRTLATLALIARRSSHSARSHPPLG
jgi:hypothetical protein